MSYNQQPQGPGQHPQGPMPPQQPYGAQPDSTSTQPAGQPVGPSHVEAQGSQPVTTGDTQVVPTHATAPEQHVGQQGYPVGDQPVVVTPAGHDPSQPYPPQYPNQPYGAPHDPNQPYGAPHDPNQPYPPVGAPQPVGATPVTPKKSNALAKLLPAILVPLLLLGLAVFVLPNMGKGAMPKVGDCITVKKDKSGDYAWDKINCVGDDKRVAFYVAKAGDGAPVCPSGDYLKYTITDSKKNTDKKYACLIPNYQKNKCYDTDPTPMVPIDCSAKEADVKFTAAYEGSDDPKQCTGTDEATTFSDPKRVYCYNEPK